MLAKCGLLKLSCVLFLKITPHQTEAMKQMRMSLNRQGYKQNKTEQKKERKSTVLRCYCNNHTGQKSDRQLQTPSQPQMSSVVDCSQCEGDLPSCTRRFRSDSKRVKHICSEVYVCGVQPSVGASL